VPEIGKDGKHVRGVSIKKLFTKILLQIYLLKQQTALPVINKISYFNYNHLFLSVFITTTPAPRKSPRNRIKIPQIQKRTAIGRRRLRGRKILQNKIHVVIK
jgi:hypothetical protein